MVMVMVKTKMLNNKKLNLCFLLNSLPNMKKKMCSPNLSFSSVYGLVLNENWLFCFLLYVRCCFVLHDAQKLCAIIYFVNNR